MEALKFTKNTDFKKNVEKARNFLDDLGKRKYGPNFQLSENFEGMAILKIRDHFNEYSFLENKFNHPKKGLLILASLKSEAFIFIELLNFYILELKKEERKGGRDIYYHGIGEGIIKIFSTRDIGLTLVSRSSNLDNVLLKYNTQYLALTDFGHEKIVGLNNYNKIDIVYEILIKRYKNKSKQEFGQLTHIITDLNAEELNSRYGSNIFFFMNKLVDLIILNNPKT